MLHPGQGPGRGTPGWCARPHPQAVDSHPSEGAAGSPAAWGGSGRRAWAGPRTPAASQSLSGPLGRRRCCFCKRTRLSFQALHGPPVPKSGGTCRSWAGSRNVLWETRVQDAPEPLGLGAAHSHQLLQRALLVDLVGAVGDVGVEVLLGVLLQDVTDVLDQHLGLVPLLQVLEEPEGKEG